MQNYTPMPAGTRLKEWRYEIKRFLMAGGFGAVYLASDALLGGRLCVLKESFDQTQEARAQFNIEAATLSTLNHPYLVRVTDSFIEKSTGRMYLVMEYIEGEDLEDILRRSPRGLPEQQVLTWMDQILDAVAYCHSFQPQVIHRDIKPGNIRIRKLDGRAVLVDFGIAKIGGKGTKTQRAAQGVTPGYSPLEQYGEGTDTYSDVYALGATMYHLLTGQVPPEAVELAKDNALLRPPRAINAAISPQTERVILIAMQVLPQHRYPTAQDMRQALQGQVATRPCVHCQAPVRIGASFCPACGKPTTTTVKPMVFPKSGYRAQTVDDLVRGCDGLWDEAARLFHAGKFDAWLDDIGEQALAQAAGEIRRRHRDSSAALEEFLQRAAPNRSRPILAVHPDPLDFGRLYRGDSKTARLTVSNSGRGYLHGTIKAEPATWLSVHPTTFGCQQGKEKRFRVEVKTAGLTADVQGTAMVGRLLVQSSQRTRRVTVHVNVVDPPVLSVSPQSLDFGTVAYGASRRRTVTIANKGGGTLQARLRTVAWLPLVDSAGQRLDSSTPLNLALPRGQSAMVSVVLDSSQLSTRGQHRGALQVEASGARNPKISIAASVTVQPPFLLDLADPGSAIRSKEELWHWCDRQWMAAMQHLASGRLEACLRFIGESQLAREAARCRRIAEPGVGLETLLRACGAPPPMAWDTNAVEVEGNLGFGFLPRVFNKPSTVKFQILNQSRRGYLHGHLESATSWLDIPDPYFGCRPAEIAEVTIQPRYEARRWRLFWASEHLFDIVVEN